MSATGQAAVSVTCPSCGKVLRVPGDRAGKMAKCPGCLNTFTVPGAQAGPASALSGQYSRVGNKKGNVKEQAGSFVLSPTIVLWGSIFLVVAGAIMTFVWGPLRVKDQWEKMEPQARQASEDVVARALQCHLSAEGGYDPAKSKQTPGTMNFLWKAPFSMTMPTRVEFTGISTEGEFAGWYYPKNGEVEAQCELGATVLPSGVRVRPGDQSIKVTGRMKGGELTVEINGKPGRIVDRRKELEEKLKADGE